MEWFSGLLFPAEPPLPGVKKGCRTTVQQPFPCDILCCGKAYHWVSSRYRSLYCLAEFSQETSLAISRCTTSSQW